MTYGHLSLVLGVVCLIIGIYLLIRAVMAL
jgi:hypothetical protein